MLKCRLVLDILFASLHPILDRSKPKRKIDKAKKHLKILEELCEAKCKEYKSLEAQLNKVLKNPDDYPDAIKDLQKQLGIEVGIGFRSGGLAKILEV